MSGISGQGTTFNLPNFTGQLFTVSPTDTKFLSAIGGLHGAVGVKSTEFDWQTFDLRAPSIRERLEGEDAPQAEERVRVHVDNVLQIFHESIDVSYTKIAAVAQLAATFTPNAGDANPVVDEVAWQLAQALKQIALDANLSLLTGAYRKPADNSQARLTRGILEAIVTNVTVGADADAGTAGNQPSDLTRAIVLDTIQGAWESGGFREEETASLFVNASLKRALTKIFVTDAGYQEGTRNVGGVAVSTIETDFGRVNVVLDRNMPVDTVGVFSLDACRVRVLDIPNKGQLFVEPLAKTGASEKSQMYGEFGLEYGHEAQHAKITNVKAPAGS